jgi:hypothetical protein
LLIIFIFEIFILILLNPLHGWNLGLVLALVTFDCRINQSETQAQTASLLGSQFDWFCTGDIGDGLGGGFVSG